jgi:heme/copper-type cytochrome/quinol oxidase subunit 2
MNSNYIIALVASICTLFLFILFYIVWKYKSSSSSSSFIPSRRVGKKYIIHKKKIKKNNKK